jgi:methylthioribose-1-phosphate isomerase
VVATRTSVVALRYDDGTLRAIDQTELPWREVELELRSAEEVAEAIRRLAIRGAPLIGVAAAYGVALELARDPTPESLDRAAKLLRDARPTAVNLSYAVDRVARAALGAPQDSLGAPADPLGAPPDPLGAPTDPLGAPADPLGPPADPLAAPADPLAAPADPLGPPADLHAAALAEARAIEAEETAASDAIAAHGAELLAGAGRILTHCNTGALAAPGRGTALAVIAELADRGSLQHVIATEARPLLQGARLTAYELDKLGIPYELIVDGAAAGLIAAGAVDAVIVGCDRVAANGDVANKVGTYGLALAANAAGIPFVVAGPTSTIDLATPTGADIAIEERDPDEVRHAGGTQLTLEQTPCRNPAFDVTPAALVTALVTERGIVPDPDATSLTSR